MLEFNKYNGFLFVGDPHVWSLQPGERLDKSYTQTILSKVEESVEIAITNNLYLIFLGDLFHKKEESNIDMLTKLTRILKKLPEPPATVEGNHEKSQLKLSDDVALSLLREAGVIYPMEKNGLWAKFNFNDGTSCYIGATPYGEKIPTNVKLPTKEKDQNCPIVWLTHHDLDFGSTYPGAIEIKEIQGVSMLVNGHIHGTKKPMTFGKMRAHNPGNISRLSTDMVDHVPAVWKWLPIQNFELEPIVLTYFKQIFNLVHKQIQIPKSPELIEPAITPQQISQFVEKMEQHAQVYDPSKTDDGTYVKESIKALARSLNLGDEFTKEMLDIHQETVDNEN